MLGHLRPSEPFMRTLLPWLSLAAGCAQIIVWDPHEYQDESPPRPLPSPYHVDRIVQVMQPEVDILWVVDDSASALDEQARLAEQFPDFLRTVDEVDHRIGVVTTDMEDPARQGRLVELDGRLYLDRGTDDVKAAFADLVAVGTDGSEGVRGRDATYAALVTEAQGANAGFLREASGVHVIVVSDGHDASELTPEALAEQLAGLRKDPEAVTYSAITSADAGHPEVTGLVGGLVRDVDDPDWQLDHLGLQATGLSREFFLTVLPVSGTIDVTVVEGDIHYAFADGEDWTYDPVRNSIVFQEYVPAPAAEIVLVYEPRSSEDDR